MALKFPRVWKRTKKGDPVYLDPGFDRLRKGGGAGGAGGWGDNLGFLGSFWMGYGGSGAKFRKAVEELLPKFSNKVTVAITGSPRSNMNDLYFLALSTAFGTMKTYKYISDNMIKTTIDRTNKKVIVELTYSTTGIGSGGNALLSAAYDNGKDVIQSGVPVSIEGADWPNFLKKNFNTNKELPLVGKTIATHAPAANYLPFNDAVSRDNDLTQVISAALLMGPCAKPGQTHTNNLGGYVGPIGQVSIGDVKAIPNPTNSSAPTAGGVDTNRWLILGQKAITETIPASVNLPPYRLSQTSSLSG